MQLDGRRKRVAGDDGSIPAAFVVESLEARTLLSATPQITAVSPDPMAIAEPAGHVYFTITGTNFSIAQAGEDYPSPSAKVVLTAPNGGYADEVQVGEITSFSSTSIQLSTTDFTMDGLPPGQWTVQVTNADGTASNAFPFAVSVSPPPAAPTITGINPDPLVVSGGTGHVLFNAEGSNFNVTEGDGDSAVTLTSPSGDTFNVLTDGGETSSTELGFNTSDFSIEPAGQWTIEVTNADGPASNVFAFTVDHTEPTIIAQPQSQTVASGADVTFGVSVTGTSPFSYQWLFNGATLAGQTAATLTLANVTSADAGDYAVIVSNSAGSMTSSAAALTVNSVGAAPGLTYALSTKASSATAGKKAKAILTVANPTAEKVKQTITIDLLLSPADSTSGQPATPAQVTRHIALKAGKSKSISIRFLIPASAQGDYLVTTQVNGAAVGPAVPLTISPAIAHHKR